MDPLKLIYYGLMLLALGASLRGYKDRKYVLFIPLLASSFFVEITREFTNEGSPLYAALSLYVAVEYTLLSLIISNFTTSSRKKLLIRWSIFIIVPIILLLKLKAVGNLHVEHIDMVISSPFICIWTILYLFETTQQDEEFAITQNPMFWISLGNLLFFSGSFFSYGFGSYLESKERLATANTIYMIARILNILLYILYFIGFICLRKKK